MELTTEEKQRIEEEERRRAAEEQYRAEVRVKLQPPAGKTAEHIGPSMATRVRRVLTGAASLLILVGIVIAFNNLNHQSKSRADDATAASTPSSTPVPKFRHVPVHEKIAIGQIVVRATGWVQYRIVVTPEMQEPTVTGSFYTSGGSGNDIQAVITDEQNYTNWINGHQAQVLWGTQGRETTGNFEVHLRPGTYFLAFSNKFSAFSEKQVFLDANLNYYKMVPATEGLEANIPPGPTDRNIFKY